MRKAQLVLKSKGGAVDINEFTKKSEEQRTTAHSDFEVLMLLGLGLGPTHNGLPIQVCELLVLAIANPDSDSDSCEALVLGAVGSAGATDTEGGEQQPSMLKYIDRVAQELALHSRAPDDNLLDDDPDDFLSKKAKRTNT